MNLRRYFPYRTCKCNYMHMIDKKYLNNRLLNGISKSAVLFKIMFIKL